MSNSAAVPGAEGSKKQAPIVISMKFYCEIHTDRGRGVKVFIVLRQPWWMAPYSLENTDSVENVCALTVRLLIQRIREKGFDF